MSSSREPSEVFAALQRALTSLGARWYVFGAQAVLIYGRPRLTTDVDLTVDVDLGNWREVSRALSAEGIHPRVEDLEGFVQRTRVLPMHHPASGLYVDVVFAGLGLESSFLANSRAIDIDGTSVPFIAPEDLLVTKLFAGRTKDIDDARGVLRIQGAALDLERTRHFLRVLESALDRSDLVRELDRMIADS